MIRDPEFYKHISIKASDHFEERLTFIEADDDKLWGNAMFLLRGEKWRNIRAAMSPAFSASRMKEMFDLVAESAVHTVKHFQDKCEKPNGKVNVELRDAFQRYTHDMIAKVSFGVNCDSFADPTNAMFQISKILMSFTPFNATIKLFIINKFPTIARALNIAFSPASTRKLFKRTVLDTIEMRKKNNIHRPDILNHLIQIRDQSIKREMKDRDQLTTVKDSEATKSYIKLPWNDDEIVSQSFLPLVAGFDTVSTLLTFTFYEIATHPDVQRKMYEEIRQTYEQLGGKPVTYDAIQNMKYMDQVFYESVRKWPTDFLASRVCTKDYTYDDGNGFKMNIKKGELFWYPNYSVARDPKYFPDPDRFDPERFSDENKSSIVSGTHIPFGAGPRYCIGKSHLQSTFDEIKITNFLTFLFVSSLKTRIHPNENSVLLLFVELFLGTE